MAPLTNSLDKLLGYQLRRASTVMMADLARELSDVEMRPAEMTTLLIIAENPDCSQSEVGEALSIKRANMVPIISRLMDRGLVTRTRVDGRSHALRVSAEGAAIVKAAWERIDRHESRFTALFDQKDHGALIDALQSIRNVQDTD
ncbi:MarR family winged helix-turn-helix transcriptional regulator [Novosphingobium cyanobacteriorum]|uniref:MarR family winged helix-turn-helix transcriptional regulator n=1 Tax=Novosphingobium cyanobacteriorum TaxID=3024215 RepID=A0ABT6CNN8_9SPHN|nr:MarR family winged helix-turn-helix transcriptional regulator [Novosphingobium cyanobacteriorum]MDF8334863.1 MarR family winged helix-turn-helix transcriptional regulator [Novosphingobium cyanobacteriorum]